MAKNEVDKIFELCLLLITVLAAAILAYAAYIYPLDGASSNLEQVNFIFRVTFILITATIVIWIIANLYPTPRGNIGFLGKFRRRFVKEFCWGLFGNFFAFEILTFVFFAFSTKLLTDYTTLEYATFFNVFLTFPATWGYVKLDKKEIQTIKFGKWNWLKSKLTHPVAEHFYIYVIALFVLQRVILYSLSVAPP